VPSAKWLYGGEIDPKSKNTGAYTKCAELHRCFSLAAADGLALALARNRHEARKMIEIDEFSRVSTERTRMLTQCRLTNAG
jgi:hypothetical protein